MQLLATAEQMQEFDRTAISGFRIPGLVLMENAGRAFVDELEKRLASLSDRRVTVVCGKGNNGGDGFVIGRHLVNRGAVVRVILLGRCREVKGDALTNLIALRKLSAVQKKTLHFEEVVNARWFHRRGKQDIIVDAIFGTGFSGRVRGIQEQAMRWVNSTAAFVAAVDIASGVDATSGRVENIAVRANLTITMAAAKIGHFIGAGGDHSGEVVVVDISIPRVVLRHPANGTFRILPQDVAAILPTRSRTAHKYSVGKVFVLAGSRSFIGAPCMCAQSALRSGAGAVILGIPRSIHETVSRKLTEVIVAPLGETPGGTVALSAMPAIMEKIHWADVVVIGPGLSRNVETDRLILEVVSTAARPLVIDADGLNALAGHTAILTKRKEVTILTPHSGELGRLTGSSAQKIDERRVESVRKAAERFGSVVVLKGAPTATGTPSGRVFVNSTGNPGMATIGSGDVLTGLIAGLCAQGTEVAASAWAGVFLHGKAGDLAAGRLGQRSLLALDIMDEIPSAIQATEMAEMQRL